MIVGIILEVVGVAILFVYFSGDTAPAYLLGGVCSVFVGISFLGKCVPDFVPYSQRKFASLRE
jgi:hypothetical protein